MSARLWEEVLSHSLAKIDETWVEASHRDLSGQLKRAPASKVAFAAVSHQAQSPQEVARFHEHVRHCSWHTTVLLIRHSSSTKSDCARSTSIRGCDITIC